MVEVLVSRGLTLACSTVIQFVAINLGLYALTITYLTTLSSICARLQRDDCISTDLSSSSRDACQSLEMSSLPLLTREIHLRRVTRWTSIARNFWKVLDNRIAIVHIVLLQSIGGRSLEPAAIMLLWLLTVSCEVAIGSQS
ncbi:hypothetical protein Tco_0111302 [Tanacetum coccineum]